MSAYLALSLFLAFICSLGSDACFARTQSVAVQGTLICRGYPATGSRVRLYDSDFPDRDDLLDGTSVDMNGNFYLAGATSELSTIDPMLSIYHDCDDQRVPCLKRVDIYIPQTAVSNGKLPDHVYQVGIINLEGNFDGQQRECID